MLRQIFSQFLMIFLLSLSSIGQAQLLCGDLFQRDPQREEINRYYENLQKDAGWFRSHLLFRNQYKVFANFSKQIAEVEAQSSQASRDYSNVLFELIHNPRTPLSPEKIQVLYSTPSNRRLTQLVLQVAAVTEWNTRVIQRAFHYIRGQEVVPTSRVGSALAAKSQDFVSRIYHFILPQAEKPNSESTSTNPTEKVSLREAATWAARGVYNGPIRYLLPFLPLPKNMHPVDRLFAQQLRDPKHQLSPQEIEMLQQANVLDAYEINQQFQNRNKTLHALRRWGSRAFVTAFAAHLVILANWSVHLSKPDSVRPIETFLEKKEYRLQSNQVRIYNESVPFPHMAIEMDGKVYSYGQTHLEVKTSQEYLMIEKIRAVAIAKAGVQPKTNESSVNLEKAFRWTGLDQLPRSVQMVTLNLNPAQKDHLKRSLELATFSRYQNHTFAMDCATMVVKALSDSTDVPVPFFKHVPIPVDASPSVMMMYFGFLKSMGVKNSDGVQLVGDVGQVAIDRAEEARMHQLRNLYINAIESRLFLTFFTWNAGIRGYVNIRYGADQFQSLDPEVRKKLIQQKVTQVESLLDSGSDEMLAHKYNVLFEEAKKLGRVPVAQRDREWGQLAGEVLEMTTMNLGQEMQESRRIFESPDTSFQDLLYAGFKMDLLQRMKSQIETAVISGNSAMATSNPSLVFEKIVKDAQPGMGKKTP